MALSELEALYFSDFVYLDIALENFTNGNATSLINNSDILSEDLKAIMEERKEDIIELGAERDGIADEMKVVQQQYEEYVEWYNSTKHYVNPNNDMQVIENKLQNAISVEEISSLEETKANIIAYTNNSFSTLDFIYEFDRYQNEISILESQLADIDRELGMKSNKQKIYDDIINGTMLGDYKLLDVCDKNSDNGFVAQTFINDNGELVVAFRGSEKHDNQFFLDWIMADAGLAFTTDTIQQKEVEKYLYYLEQEYGDEYSKVIFVGHSLGGNLSFSAATLCP